MTAIHLTGAADVETAGKSIRYQFRSSIDEGATWTILFDHTINIPEGGGGGGGGGGPTPVTPPGGGGIPPLPPDGRPQPEKGANPDPNTWSTKQMTNPPTQWKVVDNNDTNVADQFNSQSSAQQYIDHYKAAGPVTPVTPPDGGGGGGGGGGGTTPAGLRLYKEKAGGFQNKDAKESGGQGASDGIRYNVANTARIINREYTTYGTISKLASGDKMHVSPKIGSHGSEGEGSALLECSIDYTGGTARFRTEGPHPKYHGCHGGKTTNVPKIPIGKEIAFKVVQWLTGSGDDSHIDFYYSFDGTDSASGKFNWTLYGSFDYPGSNPPCEIALVKDGKVVGPAKAQDTMRMNSAFTPKPWYGEIVELEIQNGQPIKNTNSTVATPQLKEIHRSMRAAAMSREECDEKE